MGLQEHAADMEQKPEEDLAQKPEEEQKPENEQEATAEGDATEEKEDEKEEGPKSRMEEMVAEVIATNGPQRPLEKFVELALIMGATPSTPEYAELMTAVQDRCGN